MERLWTYLEHSLWVIFLPFLVTAAAASPSFDCTKAGHPSEIAICGSGDLSALDVVLDRAYRVYLSGFAAGLRGQAKLQQAAWLQQRNTCLGDQACLAASIEARIKTLGGRLPATSLNSGTVAPAGPSNVLPASQASTAAFSLSASDRSTFDSLDFGYSQNSDPATAKLLAMMLRAYPDMLAQKTPQQTTVLEELYVSDGNPPLAEGNREPALNAYRNVLLGRPAPSRIRLALEYPTFVSNRKHNPSYQGAVGSYDPKALGFWLGNSGGTAPAMTTRIPVGPLHSGPHLILDMPTLPDLGFWPMAPEKARGFLAGAVANQGGQLQLKLINYVELTNVVYDPARRAFTGDTLYFGSELRKDQLASGLTVGSPEGELLARWSPVAPAHDRMAFNAPLPIAEFASELGERLEFIDDSLRTDSQIWSKLAAARLISERPELLNDGGTILGLMPYLLSKREISAVLREHAELGTNPQSFGVFERLDLSERFKGMFGDFVPSRQADMPIKTVHVIPVQLDEYDLERHEFPLRYQLPSGNILPNPNPGSNLTVALNATLDNLTFPSSLKADLAKARQLHTYLQSNGITTVYLGVFLSLDNPAIASDTYANGQSFNVNVDLTAQKVSLFIDAELTQQFADFTAPILADQAEIDAAATSLFGSNSSGAQVVATLDALPGGQGMVRQAANFSEHVNRASADEKPAVLASVTAAIQSEPVREVLRMTGNVAIGPYDAQSGTAPLGAIALGYDWGADTRLVLSVDVQLLNAPGVLTLSPEQGARLEAYRNGAAPFRVRANVVPLSSAREQIGSIQLGISMLGRLESLEIYSGNDNSPAREVRKLAEIDVRGDTVDMFSSGNQPGFVTPDTAAVLTRDLATLLAAKSAEAGISEAGANTLITELYLADVGGLEGQGYGFFDASTPQPARAYAPLLRQELNRALEQIDNVLPEVVTVRTGFQKYTTVDSDGALVDVDWINQVFCGYFAAGGPADLTGATTYDITQRAATGSFEKPRVFRDISLVLPGSDPLNCVNNDWRQFTAAFGKRSSYNEPGPERPPVIQVVVDQLPVPPVDGGSYWETEFDARVLSVTANENGNALPDIRIELEMLETRILSLAVDVETKTVVRTTTHQYSPSDLIPVPPTAADGTPLDVFGLELGVDLEQALAELQIRYPNMKTLYSAARGSLTPAAFSRAVMVINGAGNERVTLFVEDGVNGGQTVLAIERNTHTPRWEPSMRALTKAAVKKYGAPNRAEDQIMIWGDYRRTECVPNSQTGAISAWVDANGQAADMGSVFSNDALRYGYVLTQPSLPAYGGQSAQDCGPVLLIDRIDQNLRVLLVDPGVMELAVGQTHEMLKSVSPEAKDQNDLIPEAEYTNL